MCQIIEGIQFAKPGRPRPYVSTLFCVAQAYGAGDTFLCLRDVGIQTAGHDNGRGYCGPNTAARGLRKPEPRFECGCKPYQVVGNADGPCHATLAPYTAVRKVDDVKGIGLTRSVGARTPMPVSHSPLVNDVEVLMDKPTEKQLAKFMESYAPRAFELRETKPFKVNWKLQAAEMLDYYEMGAKPNGDWCQVSGKRISSWQRAAQRWVRAVIGRMAENAEKGGRPASTYVPPAPKKQTPEAAKAAIQSFLRGEA